MHLTRILYSKTCWVVDD